MILKRRTEQNIVWGGIAGCFPVLIGWTAVTGSLAWPPVILFALVFLWTPPHYWPLSMKYKDQYEEVDVPDARRDPQRLAGRDCRSSSTRGPPSRARCC